MSRAALLYASGAFGFNILHQTMALWLAYFYAPPTESGRSVIVPLAVLGALLAVGRLIEGFDDPAIGHWSDTTRSRWGRRLPFLVGGAPFLLIAFFSLWQAPPLAMPWAALWVFVIVQLYYFFASVVHQPYEAVLAEITPDSAERVRVSSWKVAFGTLGAAVALVGSGLVIGALGFGGMALVFGLVAIGSILISALGVRRLPHVTQPVESLSLWDGIRSTLQNRQFLVFATSEMLFYLGLNMLTQLLPYFVTVILGRSEGEVSIFTAAYIAVALLSLPLVNRLAARRGKLTVYRVAMAAVAILLPGLFIIGAVPGIDPYLQSVAYIALLGVPMAALFVLPNPMIGDIVDEEGRRTGQRREGAYFGVEETVNKLGFALSTAIFGLVLNGFGFSAENPLGIRLIGPIAGGLVLIGLLLTRWYREPALGRLKVEG